MLAEIDGAALSRIIANSGDRRMHAANLQAFWRWAATPPRSWCEKEVADALEIAPADPEPK